jgi:hypothetical protein
MIKAVPVDLGEIFLISNLVASHKDTNHQHNMLANDLHPLYTSTKYFLMNKYADIEHVNHPLEIDEDIRLHIKGWKIQSVAWIVIIFFLLLAALGLFGTGPLSYRTISKNGDILEYEYFGRFQGQTELEFSLNKESGTTQIAVPQTYTDKFQIERITPAPLKTEMLNRSIVYTFNITDHGRIVFYMLPQETGIVEGTITVNNVVFSLSQFIYP